MLQATIRSETLSKGFFLAKFQEGVAGGETFEQANLKSLLLYSGTYRKMESLTCTDKEEPNGFLF